MPVSNPSKSYLWVDIGPGEPHQWDFVGTVMSEQLIEYSDDWKEDCIKFHEKVLTGPKSHWCPDWDYLPIDETCNEFDYCTCDFEDFSLEEDDHIR